MRINEHYDTYVKVSELMQQLSLFEETDELKLKIEEALQVRVEQYKIQQKHHDYVIAYVLTKDKLYDVSVKNEIARVFAAYDRGCLSKRVIQKLFRSG